MPDAAYNVQLTKGAEKDLKRLKQILPAVLRELYRLETNPELGGGLSGNLQGVRSLDWTTTKVQYRAAYVVLPEDQVCIVFHVATRENFYKEAAHRLEFVKKAIAEGRLPYPDEEEESEASNGAPAPEPPTP